MPSPVCQSCGCAIILCNSVREATLLWVLQVFSPCLVNEPYRDVLFFVLSRGCGSRRVLYCVMNNLLELLNLSVVPFLFVLS
jgi:hypothetical protein